MSIFAVHPCLCAASKRSVQMLAIPAAAAVLAFVATYTPQAQSSLDVLSSVFLFLPLVAISIVIGSRHLSRLMACLARWDSSANSKSPGSTPPGTPKAAAGRQWLIAEMGLLLLLIGVIPAAGLTRIVYRFEDLRQAEHWLRAAEQQSYSRYERARQRVVSANYSPSTRVIFAPPRSRADGRRRDRRPI
jgi:hypothetical protein